MAFFFGLFFLAVWLFSAQDTRMLGYDQYRGGCQHTLLFLLGASFLSIWWFS